MAHNEQHNQDDMTGTTDSYTPGGDDTGMDIGDTSGDMGRKGGEAGRGDDVISGIDQGGPTPNLVDDSDLDVGMDDSEEF